MINIILMRWAGDTASAGLRSPWCYYRGSQLIQGKGLDGTKHLKLVSHSPKESLWYGSLKQTWWQLTEGKGRDGTDRLKHVSCHPFSRESLWYGSMKQTSMVYLRIMEAWIAQDCWHLSYFLQLNGWITFIFGCEDAAQQVEFPSWISMECTQTESF